MSAAVAEIVLGMGTAAITLVVLEEKKKNQRKRNPNSRTTEQTKENQIIFEQTKGKRKKKATNCSGRGTGSVRRWFA